MAGMSRGLELMVKSLGIDPEEIQKSIAGFGQIIVALNASQQRTEAMVKALYDDKFPVSDPAGIRPAPGHPAVGGPDTAA